MLQEALLRERHERARRLAFSFYLKRGCVPRELKEIIAATSSWKAFAKYSPAQPRAPAGSPDGGQWIDAGGGSGGGDGDGGGEASPFLDGSGINDPPLESVYPVEALIVGLWAVPLAEIATVVRFLSGVSRTVAVHWRIRRAAKAIEAYLGGKPDRVFPNSAGDYIIMRGNKKIRFDLNKTSPHDEPHFHVQRETQNGNWVDAGKEHYYLFRKE